MQPFNRRLFLLFLRSHNHVSKRLLHKQRITNASVQKKRCDIFDKEAKRQAALITNIEKIEVNYQGQPEDCTLIMNKIISTPYNCAQHLTHAILERSVLAEVNGKVWDMHRPLEEDCTLSFLHFRQADPYYVNRAFWRSASIMLGAVLEKAFKEQLYVELCSFPSPNVRTGSFVYDADLKMSDWKPTKEELRTLSGEMVKLSLANLPFERLEVDAKIALDVFADNKYKKAQVPYIAAQSESGNSVMLYRVGTFVDMSRGPLMSHTGHMGKVSIASVHPIEVENGQLLRFQGVALPKGFLLNHFSFGILEKRAEHLNIGRVPSLPVVDNLNVKKQGIISAK
ncbi:54S ribosomal protein L39, mitochondrial [Halocaridina rubra]|uniref:Large ribosomal subunit protein mL39 n=1 Tax=Halocaridina rubra TaxID=373956 RepID=A0AAN9AB55_HALRR